MSFRLELRDKEFVVKEILDNEYLDLRWSYARVGGCGEFSFMLPRRRFQERALTGESNVRIYYRNPDTNTHDLWYQGLIENKVPTVFGNSETIPISGHGYQAQLSRVYLDDVSFTSTEASVIITSLLDTYIVPNTDITYDPGDIEVTSFTPDSITFNESVLDAIQKLSEIVGSREWGVDKDRKFYFKGKSSTTSFRFVNGMNITNFLDNQDFTQIVNQVFIQGAQVGGTYFKFGAYDDVSSQAKYNLRTRFIQNSSITTESVAAQFSSSVLEEFSEVSRRASCELIDFKAQIEATIPINLFAEISKKVKYGQKKYGTFLYSGIVNRLINRVNYSLSNNNTLQVSLDLDQLKPNVAEQISQLQYNLEQQRSASL